MESEEDNDNNFDKFYDQYKDVHKSKRFNPTSSILSDEKRDIDIDIIKKPKEKIDKRRNKQRSEKQLESLKKYAAGNHAKCHSMGVGFPAPPSPCLKLV